MTEAVEYFLDFSKPVVGFGNSDKACNPNLPCGVDRGVIERKIKRIREAIQRKDFTSDDELTKAKALLLLRDKATAAYYWLKFEGRPLVLRWYQDAILSDKHDRIIFAAANQIGKSLTLDIDATIEFMKDHGKDWVGILVSKSLEQSQYQMMRIKQLLKSASLITYREEETNETKTGKRDTTTKISYTFYKEDGTTPIYTNLLICCPPSGSALGYPCDEIWLDEFDFWENVDQRWFIYQIAIPRTFQTKGKIKIFSNPDGKEKMLWELWNQKDATGHNVWHRYNFNYWDTPGASQEGFDKASVGMTRAQIESTLLAVFTSSEGAFFRWEEIERSMDKACTPSGMIGKQPFFFLDVGATHDQCVLSGGYIEPDLANQSLLHVHIPIIHAYPVGYPLTRVVGSPAIEEDNWHYEKSVKEYLQDWTEGGVIPTFGVDVTGNSGITPLLESVGVFPIDVTFSGPVKSGMYQRFKYLMEKGLIHRPVNREWEMQASKLTIKKSTRGYMMIHHETEEDRDDYMDSTAGLIHLMDPRIGEYSTPSLMVF